MGIKDLFRKKNDEVVDLADLQKRGIYKPKLPEKDKSGVVDLSKENSNSDGSALGFLSAMAESNSDNLETSGAVVLESKKQRLNGVIGNLKMDIKQNNDRVYKLIQRIDLLEKKLDRIERRVGL